MEVSPTSITTEKNTVFYAGINLKKELVVNNKRQWILARKEDFSDWHNKKTTKCGPYKMLGGHCIGGGKEDFKLVMSLEGL